MQETAQEGTESESQVKQPVQETPPIALIKRARSDDDPDVLTVGQTVDILLSDKHKLTITWPPFPPVNVVLI